MILMYVFYLTKNRNIRISDASAYILLLIRNLRKWADGSFYVK